MPTPAVNDAERKRRRDAVNKCLRDGYTPFRVSGGRGSAATEAARRIGVDRTTMQSWIVREEYLKSQGMIDYLPDWSLYSPPDTKTVPSPDDDETDRLRLELENARVAAAQHRAEADKWRRMAGRALDFSGAINEVMAEAPKPASIRPVRRRKKAVSHTALLQVSDVHCGEVVSLSDTNGLNAYDRDICAARMERLFAKAGNLLVNHSGGDSVGEIVLLLQGDLISGEIHPELAKTNDLLSMQATKSIAEMIAGGIEHLAGHVGVPIHAVCIPGNHGRAVLKPEVKGESANSFDVMACQIAEAMLRHRGDVTFDYPSSGEAILDVHGMNLLVLHGHNLGSGGGQGYIGPIASIARGQAKTIRSYAARGAHIDLIFSGHFHTTARTPFGYSNGSVVGPSEFSLNKIKADPEPARQNLVVIAQGHGVVLHREIYLGAPEEGAIYRRFMP